VPHKLVREAPHHDAAAFAHLAEDRGPAAAAEPGLQRLPAAAIEPGLQRLRAAAIEIDDAPPLAGSDFGRHTRWLFDPLVAV
jgi:hypothetical protein